MKDISRVLFSLCSMLLVLLLVSFFYLRPVPRYHVMRLLPGQDLRMQLQEYVKKNGIKAASVISAVGSLTEASIRLANQENSSIFKGHFEIVSLSGMVSLKHTHLHLSISDSTGKTLGGHLSEGSHIYTTAEIALLEYPNLEFVRETCPLSTYQELVVKKAY